MTEGRVATRSGTCGKCFRERQVADCCPTHKIDVCQECYVENVADPIRCDLFARQSGRVPSFDPLACNMCGVAHNTLLCSPPVEPGRVPSPKTCGCGRVIEVGIADLGREWSWVCFVSDGGCGAVLGSEPRVTPPARGTT